MTSKSKNFLVALRSQLFWLETVFFVPSEKFGYHFGRACAVWEALELAQSFCNRGRVAVARRVHVVAGHQREKRRAQRPHVRLGDVTVTVECLRGDEARRPLVSILVGCCAGRCGAEVNDLQFGE